MDYFKEVNLAVTICDKEGKILEMNDKSRKTFLYYREERGKKTDLSDALVCGRRIYGVYGIVDGNTFRDETLREGGEVKG